MQLGVPGAHSNEWWSVARLLRFDRSVDLPDVRERARVCQVRAVRCRCSARVWQTRSRVRTGWGWRLSGRHGWGSPIPFVCAMRSRMRRGWVLRVNVRHCRRRRGAGTSGAMRMRARLSGACSVVSLFCSRPASARACATGCGWTGGPYGDDGTGGCRCRCLRVQVNERGEYCCVGVGFECKQPPTVMVGGCLVHVVFGGVLLSHTLSSAVPSALEGLASGFGMGPGVSPPLWPP